jgi:hypothetical protein
MSWEKNKHTIHTKWKTYWYHTHPSEIAIASWDYLFTGGKEIRARLFCELWSYLSPDIEVDAELAFAIECIHAASLILDDTPWMDNASTRRGKPTLHLIFSNRKSILLFHDVMYMVYCIWSERKPVHLESNNWNELLSHTLKRLMIGQLYDLEKKGTLIELASMKTGVLFELVAETVAACTNLDRNTWKLWGNHLGILFQWMDDWHDRDEDVIQQNRNAFNESYDITLTYYTTIWTRIEQAIGPSWFKRAFGQYMKQYFTQHIPFNQDTIHTSLSDLFLSYPIHILPSIDEPDPCRSVELDSMSVLINRRNSYEFTKEEIEQLIRSKHPFDITINGITIFQIDMDELFHLELMKWLQLLQEQNPIKITGKQMIQLMLRLLRMVESKNNTFIETYRARYMALKQKIWYIDESEWEFQPEIIDFMYDEFQSFR